MTDDAREERQAVRVKALASTAGIAPSLARPTGVVAPELRALAGTLTLRFPIASKKEFVEQLTASAETVRFNGIEYDTEFAAGLIPSFFFPIADLDDLLHKSTELLLSRGLIPGHG